MAAFRNGSKNNSDRLDWKILQDGWASLYWSYDILNKDLKWFSNEKFEIISFNCSKWIEEQKINDDLKKQLHFPDYYGENLNALEDCLSDLLINEYGLVIIFEHFQFVNKKYSHQLLEVFANRARRAILVGKKLLILIQVDDGRYQIESIGARAISWNNSEWLTENRGL